MQRTNPFFYIKLEGCHLKCFKGDHLVTDIETIGVSFLIPCSLMYMRQVRLSSIKVMPTHHNTDVKVKAICLQGNCHL